MALSRPNVGDMISSKISGLKCSSLCIELKFITAAAKSQDSFMSSVAVIVVVVRI